MMGNDVQHVLVELTCSGGGKQCTAEFLVDLRWLCFREGVADFIPEKLIALKVRNQGPRSPSEQYDVTLYRLPDRAPGWCDAEYKAALDAMEALRVKMFDYPERDRGEDY